MQTAQEADEIVRAMRFHPEGTRGMAPFTRLHDWSGENSPDGEAGGSERPATSGILVEDSSGLAQLDDILDVPGLDLVYLGIYDISQNSASRGR